MLNQGLENGPFVVWYDESQHLGPLVKKSIPENVNFIEFQGSYLEIRKRIDISPQAFTEKWIIYVAEKPLEPSWLRQYELLGQIIQKTLPEIIEQMEIKLTAEIKAILNSSSGRTILSIWDEILAINPKPTSNVILDALFAKSLNIDLKLDMKDVIFQIILKPDCILEGIQKENMFEHLRTKLRQLGLTLQKGTTNVDIALLLVTSIIFSQFPKYNINSLQKAFAELIPKEKPLKFWQEVFELWKEKPQYTQKYIDYWNQVEEKYHIIDKLSSSILPELLKVEIVPDFENYLLERINAQFLGTQTTSLSDKLILIQNLYNERKNKSFISSGENTSWEILGLVIKMYSEIDKSEKELKSSGQTTPDSAQLIRDYAGKAGWWQIDDAYLKLIEKVNKPYEEWIKTEIIDKVINKYADWLDQVNRTWVELIGKEKKWSPSLTLIPTKIWTKILKIDQQKVAIMFIDAFRADLAWRLKEQLSLKQYFDIKPDEIKDYQFFSGLPSKTPVGMLLPLNQTPEAFSFERKGKNFEIRFQGDPLNSKEDRKNYIHKNLGNSVDFFELLDFIKKTKTELALVTQEKKVLVLYYNEIDNHGIAINNNQSILDKFLNNIVSGVQKLIESGFRHIILIPDHGFLIYPENFSPQLMKIPSKQDDLIKERRFALGSPTDFGEHNSIIKLKLSDFGFQSDLVAIFPIGIHQFIVPGDKPKFDHGGLSLQENALTLLEIKVKEKKLLNPVKIDIEFPENITTAKVIVKIKPINPEITNKSRAIVVKAFDSQNIESQIGCSKVINIHFNPMTVDVNLQQLPKNTQIKVVDEQSGEILGEKMIPVLLAGYDDLL